MVNRIPELEMVPWTSLPHLKSVNSPFKWIWLVSFIQSQQYPSFFISKRLVHFNIGSYHIKMNKTSWTRSIMFQGNSAEANLQHSHWYCTTGQGCQIDGIYRRKSNIWRYWASILAIWRWIFWLYRQFFSSHFSFFLSTLEHWRRNFIFGSWLGGEPWTSSDNPDTGCTIKQGF